MQSRSLSLLAILAFLLPQAAFAQGLAISGMGPINSSMAGAATASPLDASGALMWNPATISGLECSEVSFGVSLVLPSSHIRSTIPAGALGGLPPVTLSGFDESSAGVSAVPNIGWVEHLGDSPWSIGLGVFGIGGFRVNYPASVTNPVLTPQPPGGLGVGRIFAEAEIMQVLPTISYVVSDRLSIGVAPSLTLANISSNTLQFAAPDDANGDGFPTYPEGRGGRMTWGGGFQVGVYYIDPSKWHFGAAVKSPQWLEPFRFQTQDELGRPRTAKVRFEYPLIVTLGTAYSGLERWVFALDVRLFDYGGADGFGDSGFRPDGSLAGLGWSTILATSAGVQFQADECLFLRCGYSFNQNPLSDFDTGFNVASPLSVQHFVYTGFTVQATEQAYFSVTYLHGFENETSGPIQTPLGPIPGSLITSGASLDALSMGINVRY